MQQSETLTERLRRTTELMANHASVDMILWNDHSSACLEAVAALTQSDPTPLPAPVDGIPEGWQLVPKRMDVGMIGAWYRYKNGHRFQGEPPATDTSDVGAWEALLAATPHPPASPLPSGTVGEPVGEDETEICPVCGESLKAEAMCATDIELGICHAACLDGTPTVYLDTGEPSEGPIDTYRYGDVAVSPPSEPAPQVVGDWRPMKSAPKDGKHVILAVQRDCFVYAIQGAFMQGKWLNAADIKAEPLCWMPNVSIPDEYLPWVKTATEDQQS